MTFTLLNADAIEAMQAMAENSVDAIVTDPPYGLEFMGKEWDRLAPYERGNPNMQNRDVAIRGTAEGEWQPGRTIRTPKRIPRCRKCGKQKWNQPKSKCVCPNPEWDLEGYHHNYGMQSWHEAWATEALRILKPGGHLLAFGGTRTYHRLACAIEDAGFEIRDCIAWMYGSGFPKSLDVSKAIDKAAGAEREVVGQKLHARDGDVSHQAWTRNGTSAGGDYATNAKTLGVGMDTAPATPEAQRWNGWGTALKPAFEPVVLARKPLAERNVAANVQRWGTGALNIDGCRIEGETAEMEGRSGASTQGLYGGTIGLDKWEPQAAGRWPANVTLDETAAAMLDEQTGELTSRLRGPELGKARPDRSVAIGRIERSLYTEGTTYDDTGGASRFFAIFPACGDESTEAANTSDGVNPEIAASTNGSTTDGSGSKPTAPFQQGSIFTTETTTPSTTTSPTSSPSSAATTSTTTGPSAPPRSSETGNGAAPAAGSGSPLTSTPPAPVDTAKAIASPASANTSGSGERGTESATPPTNGPIEQATRFRYVAKADREERNRGLGGERSSHPTVKPVELMRWLCRMVTPKGGTVLDPFTGSGSTGVAAMREGFEFIGIEREAEYVEIARSRIYGDSPLFNVEVGGGPTE